VQEFGDTAAEGGAVHMQEAESLERSRGLDETLDRLFPGRLRVVGDVLGLDRDGWKHAFESTERPLAFGRLGEAEMSQSLSAAICCPSVSTARLVDSRGTRSYAGPGAQPC
jgi:hypothetical protein